MGNFEPGTGKVSSLENPRGLFDHIFYVPSASRDTWVPKSTAIFDPTKAGAQYADYPTDFSDHVPVVTSLFIETE